jgi:HEAT repeat protein
VKTTWFITLCLLGTIAVSSPGAAERPMKPRSEPWVGVAQELAKKGIPLDTPSIVKAALSHPDLGVRSAAVELLGLRGEISSQGALRKVLLDDESLLVRETAALALARFKEPGALENLKEFMVSSEEPTRQLFLATRLAELGDLGGSSQIAKAAASDDEHLRFLSAESLVLLLTLDRPVPEVDPSALLLKLLSDGSAKVRQEVLLQLAVAFGKGFSLKPFLSRIERMAKQDPDAKVREQAELLLASWKVFGKPRSER